MSAGLQLRRSRVSSESHEIGDMPQSPATRLARLLLAFGSDQHRQRRIERPSPPSIPCQFSDSAVLIVGLYLRRHFPQAVRVCKPVVPTSLWCRARSGAGPKTSGWRSSVHFRWWVGLCGNELCLGASSGFGGKVNRRRAPPVGLDSTFRVPLWADISSATIARPRTPPASRSLELSSLTNRCTPAHVLRPTFTSPTPRTPARASNVY